MRKMHTVNVLYTARQLDDLSQSLNTRLFILENLPESRQVTRLGTWQNRITVYDLQRTIKFLGKLLYLIDNVPMYRSGVTSFLGDRYAINAVTVVNLYYKYGPINAAMGSVARNFLKRHHSEVKSFRHLLD